MAREPLLVLALVVGLGLVVRVVIGFAAVGVTFDIQSWELTYHVLVSHPLHVYSAVNSAVDPNGVPLLRFPYPPGFLPFLAAAGAIAASTGLPFHGLVKLPAILADTVLALVIQDHLGWLGRPVRERLAAAALIALSPTFGVISGFHGQIDAFASLPAVIAVVVWTRMPGGRRAGWAGLLIGAGAAVKILPILALFGLLPSARNNRERVVLVGATLAVPVALLVPFVVVDPHGVWGLRHYAGLPGFGGISMILQPGLVRFWLYGDAIPLSGAIRALLGAAPLLTLVSGSTVALGLLRTRVAPAVAVSVVWLAFYVFGATFEFQWLCYGIPFFLLAGRVREVAVLQALLLVPTIMIYTHPRVSQGAAIYFGFMLVVWLVMAGSLTVGAWGALAAARRQSRPGNGRSPRAAR